MSTGALLLLVAVLATVAAGWVAGRFLARGPWRGLIRVLLVALLSLAILFVTFEVSLSWETHGAPYGVSFAESLRIFARKVFYGSLAGMQNVVVILCAWLGGILAGFLSSNEGKPRRRRHGAG